MPVRICRIQSSAVSGQRVSYRAIAPPAVRFHNLAGTYLAMITTSGCRPITVGDQALRSVMYLEKRKPLEVLFLNESYATPILFA
jgi:hypothetical protein